MMESMTPAPERTRPEALRPALSVCLITKAGYEHIRKTVGFLKQQTALEQLELVLVVPSREAFDLDEEDIATFRWFQVVEVGPIRSTGRPFAAAIHAARADWAIYGEEHSFPEWGWAEALIRAQQGPYSVIGSAMANANQDTLTSWAHLLAQFGPVVVPVESGPAHYVAGHHSSYLREPLLELGAELPRMLDAEIAMHQALVAQGHQLYLAADAVSHHANLSQFRAFARIEFLGQRVYAGMRSRALGWSWAKRLLYAAGSPLIPIVRLARTSKDVRRVRSVHQLSPRIYLLMGAAMAVGAVGEAIGYLFGSGRGADQRVDLELDRYAFTVEPDRQARPQAGMVDSN
jgi:hypothetical protein